MKALLDTHTFLWWITDDPRLTSNVRKVIGNNQNVLYLSAASCWEIAIKSQLGRIGLPGKLDTFISDQISKNSFTGLPVQISHAVRVASLPAYHRDPFDRLLVAQAQVENLPLITNDKQMMKYSVELMW